MRYQKIGDVMVSPLVFTDTAYELARKEYAKYNKNRPKKDRCYFHKDVNDHLKNGGVVISRPDIFALAKVIELDGRRGWFVRFALGNMVQLLMQLPCVLPFIAFCRKDKNMRIVELGEFVRKAIRLEIHKTAAIQKGRIT